MIGESMKKNYGMKVRVGMDFEYENEYGEDITKFVEKKFKDALRESRGPRAS